MLLRTAEVEYDVGQDVMPGPYLVENDIQCRVAKPVDQFQTLVWVMVYYHGIPGTNMKMAGTGMLLSSP
jgi:hypothetical protein